MQYSQPHPIAMLHDVKNAFCLHGILPMNWSRLSFQTDGSTASRRAYASGGIKLRFWCSANSSLHDLRLWASLGRVCRNARAGWSRWKERYRALGTLAQQQYIMAAIMLLLCCGFLCEVAVVAFCRSQNVGSRTWRLRTFIGRHE